MKKFFLLALISLTVMAASAQTFLVRNGDEHIYKTYTTDDSAYHYIDSLVMASNEAGVFEVSVVGYATDTLYAVTGVLKYRYNKRGGTLTLGTVVNDQTPVTDTPLGTATFDIYTTGNKAYVRIKGKLGNTIVWRSVVKRKSISL